MNIKNHIIKHFIKFKVVHSIPGRLRLKVNNASKIPQEAKEYDKYVVQGLKMLDGIKDLEFNYITGSVVITYDTKKSFRRFQINWRKRARQPWICNRYFRTKIKWSNKDNITKNIKWGDNKCLDKRRTCLN